MKLTCVPLSDPTVPRSDRLAAGHPDVPRGDHQEPGPGAEPAEGEAVPAGGGARGGAEPEPELQRAAQTDRGAAGAGRIFRGTVETKQNI